LEILIETYYRKQIPSTLKPFLFPIQTMDDEKYYEFVVYSYEQHSILDFLNGTKLEISSHRIEHDQGENTIPTLASQKKPFLKSDISFGLISQKII